MQSKLQQHWLPPSGLRFLVVVMLLLGVFFRFVHLDRKVYWYDETRTSIRAIAAYAPAEVVDIFDGQLRNPADLLRYQQVDDRRDIFASLTVMAADDPKHTPLYYALVGVWARAFGDSIGTIRLLSALLSLLVFPCFYWLCLELFGSPTTAWLAIGLMAVSPFHVLYAQEARQYALSTAVTLLSSAALLRSIRLKTKASWIFYGLTIALGFYSFLLFGCVLLAHAAYVGWMGWQQMQRPLSDPEGAQRWRMPRIWLAFGSAALVGGLAFAPWAALIVGDRDELRIGWLEEPTRLGVLIKSWILGFSAVFFDSSGTVFLDAAAGVDRPLTYAMRLPLLLLIGYALHRLYRQTPKSVWLFVFALMGATAIVLVLPDLLLDGRRSSVPRYLIPCYLGVQLAVAHLLTTQSLGAVHQKLWRSIAALVLSAGVLSCLISSQADTWWTKAASYDIPELARLINQAESPVLIGTYSFYNATQLLSLSHCLAARVKLQLLEKPDVTRLDRDSSSDRFLYNPDEVFQQMLTDWGYRLQPVHDRGKLWRLIQAEEVRAGSP